MVGVMLFNRSEKIDVNVAGMTCEHCAQAVEDALGEVEGVKSVKVDLAKGRARVRAGDGTDQQALVEAVTEAGYEAHLS
ncbi:MAG: heavy metal-associated domain-containing protein [Candidatus Thermoplasmatota archaeon]|nr:heavy metal-associated domain-containing protein [Candidatus Thermoplasmatota archaeon]